MCSISLESIVLIIYLFQNIFSYKKFFSKKSILKFARHETVNTISEHYSPRVESSIPVMAHSHCTGPGPGQEPGINGFSILHHVLYTLHRHRNRDHCFLLYPSRFLSRSRSQSRGSVYKPLVVTFLLNLFCSKLCRVFSLLKIPNGPHSDSQLIKYYKIDPPIVPVYGNCAYNSIIVDVS